MDTGNTETTGTMRPFMRQEPFKCPKCGWGVAKRRYCKGLVSTNKDGEKVYACPEGHSGEHMHVVCEDCGYTQSRSIPKDTKK